MQLRKKLEKLNSYPFHMPGHKRMSGLGLCGENIDITEIDGFDNLHSPTGVLKDLENKTARLFGVSKSIISTNGATCGVLSAVSAVAEKGGEILVCANCHKSVFNACELNDLDVFFIAPEYNEEFCCWESVTQKSIDDALENHPNACAVVLTSPTYEGFISNIKCGVPLIVDAAHGAHFGFADWLPERPSADIIIESLHKTLPSLTQTAVVHINNPAYFDKVKKYMDVFETSSPSYILLDSVDRCLDFLEDSENAFFDYKNNLDYFYESVKGISNASVLDNDDKTRIILSVNGYTGTELSDFLRNNFNIEAEGAALKYVILISSICDKKYGFDLLLKAIKSLEIREKLNICVPRPEPAEKMPKCFCVKNIDETALANSKNKISAEYAWAYPPGCPIVVPGEKITDIKIEYLNTLLKNNVNVLSNSSLLPLKILTKRED